MAEPAFTDEQIRKMFPEGPQARAKLDPAWLKRAATGKVGQGVTEAGDGAGTPEQFALGAYETDANGDLYKGAGFLSRNEDGTYDLAVGGRWIDQYDADGNWIARHLDESAWSDWRDSVGKMALYSAGAYYGTQGLDNAIGGAADASLGAGSGSAAGGTTAGQQGVNWGKLASTANKSGLLNAGMTAVQGGDLSDVLKSYGYGAAGSAMTGGLTTAGVDPTLARAASSMTVTAARGGGGSDILRAGAGSGFSGWATSDGGLTGTPALDRAIGTAGSALFRGKDGQGALLDAASSYLTTSAQGNRNNADASRGGDAFEEAASGEFENGAGGDDSLDGRRPVDFDYQSGWDDDPDILIDTRGDENGYGGLLSDPLDTRGDENGVGGPVSPDPYGPGSGYGKDTLTNMGATNDTNPQTPDILAGLGQFLKGLGFNGKDLASLGLGGLNYVLAKELAGDRAQADMDLYKMKRTDQLTDAATLRAQEIEDRQAKWEREERLQREKWDRMRPVTGLLAPTLKRV